MLFYTVGQSRIFLTMLYCGMLTGVYVSIDHALRRLFRSGRIFCALMDLVLGIVAALFIIAGLLSASVGELRLYALLGVLCGFLLYMATVYPLLERLLGLCAHLFGASIDRLSKVRLVKKLFK